VGDERREGKSGMGSACTAAPPSQPVEQTESGGRVVHGVECTSRQGTARETETLLGFKRRRFRQEGNGRSSIETEGALCGIIKF